MSFSDADITKNTNLNVERRNCSEKTSEIMSRINYAKWNAIDDSDDDASDKKTFDTNLLLQWKRVADTLFETGESENDCNHYKNAQVTYQRIVSEIEEKGNNTVDTNILSLLFSCKLNIVTCFAKLNEWKNVKNLTEIHVKHYESAFFDENYKIISKEQFVRLLYFSVYANINDITQLDASTAIKYGLIMKKMLDLIPPENITIQIRNDYNKLFESLEEIKEKIIKTVEENYTIDYFSNNMHLLLQNERFEDVIDTYNRFMQNYQLNNVPNHELIRRISDTNSNSVETQLLSKIFRSYADAMINTGNSSSAADALIRAAYFCNIFYQKKSLYIRAATLYYNSKQYYNAIESYNEVLCANIDIADEENAEKLSIDNDIRIIFAIAKLGLGASYNAIEDFNSSQSFLEDAIAYFENYIYIKITDDYNFYVHTLNCYESLIQCYTSLKLDEKYISAYKKVITLCKHYNSANSGENKNCPNSNAINALLFKTKSIKYSILLINNLPQETVEEKIFVLDVLEDATLLSNGKNES